MKKSEHKKGEIVDLDEINIILKIPKDAARIELVVHMFDDEGEHMKFKKVLGANDIRDARQDFLDNVEDGDDYDARYVITEAGLEYLEALKRGDPEAIRRLDEIAAAAENGEDE